ncbi:extracellular solute-binding protein [Anaerolineae bacterium CFX9]|jgi:multiple sugar transport system substrate-binding protein|nr:extracellular solute-binding protein [Anaerolineae bacterium CFX9]
MAARLFLLFLFAVLCIVAPVSAQGNFAGQVIVVATQAANEISGPIDQFRSEWEAQTGAIVVIEQYPFAQLYEAIMESYREGTQAFDMIVYAPNWSGDIMGNGYVTPIPDSIKDQINWDDVLPLFRERILDWGGTTYALPFDGDSHMMYYRSDLVNPDGPYAEAFQAAYGYPLDEPETWSQYRDIAEFFNLREVNNAGVIEPIYGVAEAQRPQAQSFWFLISRAAGYAKVPGDPCFFFSCSPDSPMVPRVNNPGWVRGLEDAIAIREFGPPEMSEYDVVEVRDVFPAGRTVFALDWGDIGPLSIDRNRSIVNDLVGFSVLPGAEQYWDYNANGGAGAWVDAEGGVNRAPFIAFGGWVISVSADSPEMEAALDFAAFMSGERLAGLLATTPGTGVNPLRRSQFQNLELWLRSGFSEAAALDYLDAIQSTIEHPNAVLDIRIPGSADYGAALDIEVGRALAGEISAQEALDNVAAAWEAITDSYGREAQLEFYLASLGL